MWVVDGGMKYWYCPQCDRPLDIPVECPDCPTKKEEN